MFLCVIFMNTVHVIRPLQSSMLCYDITCVISIQPYLFAVGAPLPVPDSMTPTGEIFPNHREWSIKFNKQVWLPLRLLTTGYNGTYISIPK